MLDPTGISATYVPYSGATADVALGTHTISTAAITSSRFTLGSTSISSEATWGYLAGIDQRLYAGATPDFATVYLSDLGGGCVLYADGGVNAATSTLFTYDGNTLSVTSSGSVSSITAMNGSVTAVLANGATGCGVYTNYFVDAANYYVSGSAGASGTFLRSAGAGYVASTLTIPNTITSTQVVIATGTNALGSGTYFTCSTAGLVTITGTATTDGLATTGKLTITGITGGTGAVGSAISLGTGAGGNKSGAGATAGAGGGFSSTLGNGGTGSSTPSTGGAGGSLSWTAGNGGTGVTANGAGGGITLAAGTSATVSKNGNILFKSGTTEIARFDNSVVIGCFGIGITPTAILHLKAGTLTAGTSPLKFSSGTSMTTAEAGAVEFTTDNLYFTITTGAARKGFVFDDGTLLTSGRVPYSTTNGRLTDITGFTFNGTTLTAPAFAAGTSVGVDGSFQALDGSVITVTKGIITNILPPP